MKIADFDEAQRLMNVRRALETELAIICEFGQHDGDDNSVGLTINGRYQSKNDVLRIIPEMKRNWSEKIAAIDVKLCRIGVTP